MGQKLARTPTPVHDAADAAPEGFVDVRRSLLALGSLCLRDAAALTYVHYRAARRHTVSGTELARLMACDRATGCRSLWRLQEAGWLDGDRRPARPLPVGKKGFVRVYWKAFHDHGCNDAFVLTQLGSMHAIKKARTEDHRTLALPGLIASLLGLCADGVRNMLARLETGDTTRQRLEARRHERAPEKFAAQAAAPLIERTPGEYDTRMSFRFVSERERMALKATSRPAQINAFARACEADVAKRLQEGAEYVLGTLRPPSAAVRC